MTSNSTGLANLGNTCFLNSVLQSLFSCESIQQLEESIPLRSESKKTDLFKEFLALQREVHTASGYVVPRQFLQTLLRTIEACDDDWYRPRQQADAAECLHYILDGIHDSIYRTVRITIQGTAKNAEEESQIKAMKAWSAFFEKEYSPIVEQFYGQHQLKVTCKTCGSVSERYEPWSMLKLPIPGGETAGAPVPTMEDCLNAFYTSEEVEDYACDSCKSRQVATLQTRISKLPHILILCFKRFTNRGLKIRGRIDWDTESLSFQPWSAFQKCPYANSSMMKSYKTFAVIEHVGSAHSGHYYMNRRITDKEAWVQLDDSSVHPVASDSIVTPDSYILFLTPK